MVPSVTIFKIIDTSVCVSGNLVLVVAHLITIFLTDEFIVSFVKCENFFLNL